MASDSSQLLDFLTTGFDALQGLARSCVPFD